MSFPFLLYINSPTKKATMKTKQNSADFKFHQFPYLKIPLYFCLFLPFKVYRVHLTPSVQGKWLLVAKTLQVLSAEITNLIVQEEAISYSQISQRISHLLRILLSSEERGEQVYIIVTSRATTKENSSCLGEFLSGTE